MVENKTRRGLWLCFSLMTLALILGPAWKVDAPVKHALIKGFALTAPKNPLLKQQNYIAPTPSFIQRMTTRKA